MCVLQKPQECSSVLLLSFRDYGSECIIGSLNFAGIQSIIVRECSLVSVQRQ